jgi:glycosyltransferase involved in cell wall biosynthesis
MRVLVINQYYPPDASATAYLLSELTEDMARDHEVWVIAGRPSYNPDALTAPPANVRLRRARSTSFSRSTMAGRMANYVTFLASSGVAAARAPRPDVVFAFTDPPLAALVGRAVAAGRRARFVYVCWDLYPDIAMALGRLQNPFLIAGWRALNRLVRARADSVVAVGRDMCEKLESEGVPAEKVDLIRHWSTVEPPSAAATAEARRRMEWNGRFVVMHAGNVGLAQNLDMLVEAADILRGRDDVEFVVLGEGAARARLEGEARRRGLERLRFLPQASRRDAQPLLAAADLHLVSHAPGLLGTAVPSKVYGLLALGKPFIAAVEEGSEIDRLVSETGAGVRVAPGDASRLASLVEEFAAGTRDRERAGRSAREAYENTYRREHGTARYLALLDRIESTTTGIH